MPLPEGYVCLEGSYTAAAYRGRGLAPAVLITVLGDLQREGLRSVVTKIEPGNAPSRRAAAKLGFGAVAIVRFRRLGPVRRVAVDRLGEGFGAELARALATGAQPLAPALQHQPA